MSFADSFLPEFTQEMAITRPVLERVPGDRGEWRPHVKSFPVGHLAQLVARMPGWITNVATESKLNMLTYPGYSFEPTETLLREFDAHVTEATTALQQLDDRTLGETWSLVAGDKVLLSAPRGVTLRQTLNHLIHHRGQLTVYLRLLEIPVPSIYGPSADDRGNFGG